jgi:hypothetical protein
MLITRRVTDPQPRKQSPIVCKIDGKEIPEGIKVRFVVNEKTSDPDEIVWQTIQWTINDVRVDSKIDWSKVLNWLKNELMPSTEGTGTGEIRFWTCLLGLKHEDLTGKVHVVEVN